ncbi:hypothetical protein EJ02DRAFT_418522 [Clathrospora elynae]|uniref:Uncharacterized protein n=1 Tax=Clathrospora elynae TaxID=706981 RepID=A0A6A5T2P5_9PLEO|nr:hypothetical protein EJ02DRAFT_418522 [Clathrospora elynae]
MASPTLFLLAFFALISIAIAQTSIDPAAYSSVSVLEYSAASVFATAIPSDQFGYVAASPKAFFSELQASLSASSTPSWYDALPSDVKLLVFLEFDVSSGHATTTSSMLTPTSLSANATVHRQEDMIHELPVAHNSNDSSHSELDRKSGASESANKPTTPAAAVPTEAQPQVEDFNLYRAEIDQDQEHIEQTRRLKENEKRTKGLAWRLQAQERRAMNVKC